MNKLTISNKTGLLRSYILTEIYIMSKTISIKAKFAENRSVKYTF